MLMRDEVGPAFFNWRISEVWPKAMEARTSAKTAPNKIRKQLMISEA